MTRPGKVHGDHPGQGHPTRPVPKDGAVMPKGRRRHPGTEFAGTVVNTAKARPAKVEPTTGDQAPATIPRKRDRRQRMTPPANTDATAAPNAEDDTVELHVRHVPRSVWLKARQSALASGLRFGQYVIKLLENAEPPPPSRADRSFDPS